MNELRSMKTTLPSRIAAAREEVRTYCNIQGEIDQSFADGRKTGVHYNLRSNALREQVRERSNLAFMALSHALVIGDWLVNETIDRERLERVALAMLDVYEAIVGADGDDEAER